MAIAFPYALSIRHRVRYSLTPKVHGERVVRRNHSSYNCCIDVEVVGEVRAIPLGERRRVQSNVSVVATARLLGDTD